MFCSSCAGLKQNFEANVKSVCARAKDYHARQEWSAELDAGVTHSLAEVVSAEAALRIRPSPAVLSELHAAHAVFRWVSKAASVVQHRDGLAVSLPDLRKLLYDRDSLPFLRKDQNEGLVVPLQALLRESDALLQRVLATLTCAQFQQEPAVAALLAALPSKPAAADASTVVNVQDLHALVAETLASQGE
jgi:hypothetical protein